MFSTCSSNSTDELPCSGNGECACGKCVCKAVSEQNNDFEMLVRKKKTAFDLDEGKRLGSNIMDTIRLVFADAVIASCLGARKKVLWGLVPVQ